MTLTACDVLDMAKQLDYAYDELPVNNVQLCAAPGSAPAPNFVGLIGLFGEPGHGDEAVMTFDITDKLDLLRAAVAEAPAEGEGEAGEAGEAGESGEGGATAESSTPATPGFADELTVTFVRHNLDSGESPAASEPFIRFSRVSLVEQPAGPGGSV